GPALQGVRIPRLPGQAPHRLLRLELRLRRAAGAAHRGHARFPPAGARRRRTFRRSRRRELSAGAGDRIYARRRDRLAQGQAPVRRGDRALAPVPVSVALPAPNRPDLQPATPPHQPPGRRASLTVEPRSAYLLQGPARRDWEHSIPGVERLRYSITFRNFRDA